MIRTLAVLAGLVGSFSAYAPVVTRNCDESQFWCLVHKIGREIGFQGLAQRFWKELENWDGSQPAPALRESLPEDTSPVVEDLVDRLGRGNWRPVEPDSFRSGVRRIRTGLVFIEDFRTAIAESVGHANLPGQVGGED